MFTSIARNFVLLSLLGILASPAQNRPNLREVNGQTYDLNHSQLWTNRTFEFVRRLTNDLVVARRITYEKLTERRFRTPDLGGLTANQRIGAYSGPAPTGDGWRTVTVGTNRIEGDTVVITNLTRKDLIPEKEFTIPTMITGEHDGMQLHDVGTMSQNSAIIPAPKARPKQR